MKICLCASSFVYLSVPPTHAAERMAKKSGTDITHLHHVKNKIKICSLGLLCISQKNERGACLQDAYPVCKKCDFIVAGRGGNPSNMFAHLQKHHPSRSKYVSSL